MDYFSLCLICKDENDYLPEWLNYHILMGVDRFYIYDNDSRLSLRESLKDYIERNWVVVVDIHGEAMQLFAYDHCLQTFGPQTYWLGFIDTDEFLVPKKNAGLKELLKDYEAYGGLAVSSLFFGSSEKMTRPVEGQISAYTYRTHETAKDNELVKSIVQPRWTLMPNSPHDFTYAENHWCVNEGFLRVDGQRFPNYTSKIQLNHYYCRSESELEDKLRRGNSGAIVWPRKRFDTINALATNEDTCITKNLDSLLEDNKMPYGPGLQDQMSELTCSRRQLPFDAELPVEAMYFRPEFVEWVNLKVRVEMEKHNKDYLQVHQTLLKMVEIHPQSPLIYINMAVNCLNLNDPQSAWQTLSEAWKIGKGTYDVLGGMAFYFLGMKNYSMAEKTSRLILDIAPHDLAALGFLTQSLVGLASFDEALKVGLPLVELSAVIGEFPNGTDIHPFKLISDHLLEKKEYVVAIQLWEAVVKCQPEDTFPLLELSHAMLLAGNKSGAYQRLVQVQALAPQDDRMLALLKQAEE